MSTTGAPAMTRAKVGRNDACPCGSGRKFKHCCQAKETGARTRAGKVQGSPLDLKRRLKALFLAGKQHFDARRWAEAIPPFHEIAQLDPSAGSPRPRHDLAVLRPAD